MTIIEIQSLSSGAHRVQEIKIEDDVPSGWAIMPEELKGKSFPFGDIIVDDNNLIVISWEDREKPELGIQELKEKKKKEISQNCNDNIINGIDIITTKGIEHFSLNELDQINLNAAYNAIISGALFYPYHADGKLCRNFSANEIKELFNAYTKHKIYHTTLCNHLFRQIDKINLKNKLSNIAYDVNALDLDLQKNFYSLTEV